jgi:hypothetical protein
VYVVQNFTLKEALANLSKNSKLNTDLKSCTVAPRENALWRDENGDNLVAYLHYFINVDHTTQLQHEIEKLMNVGTLSIPKKQHRRYSEAIKWIKFHGWAS